MEKIKKKDETQMILESLKDFESFTFNIFSQSFEKFIGGKHISWTSKFLQDNKKTMRISAKDHYKSTSLYALFMWKMFKADRSFEGHYFSYEPRMAAYHTRKIKELIEANPYFAEFVDLKPASESIISYQIKAGLRRVKVSLFPQSLQAFKRGIHAPLILVDDPFQDPESKLNPTKVLKINEVFKTQIVDMPTIDGELHVVGTAQTNQDFFFDKDLTERFEVVILPAIINEKEKEVRWPEHLSYEELIQRRKERGERIFMGEYQCRPIAENLSWFTRERLLPAIKKDLKPLNILNTENLVSLGWDIGKKKHPSHVTIYEKVGEKWIMRYQEFMDDWEYTKQVEHVNNLMDKFSVNHGYYDDTRGELEAFKENHLLHDNLAGIRLEERKKMRLATEFDIVVSNEEIEIMDDPRLISQILAVDSLLHSTETREGHGEAFWSSALAFEARSKGTDFFVLK